MAEPETTTTNYPLAWSIINGRVVVDLLDLIAALSGPRYLVAGKLTNSLRRFHTDALRETNG